MANSDKGTVSGQGTITRKNGEVVEFEIKSDPLTETEAEKLIKHLQEQEDGSNSSDDNS